MHPCSFGSFAERPPHVRDHFRETVLVDDHVRPQRLHQKFLLEQFTTAFDQQKQRVETSRKQRHRLAAAQELAARRVDALPANSKMRRCCRSMHPFRIFRTPARHSARSSIILGNMESTLNVHPVSFTAKYWLILVTAGLGFAFDLYEMVVHGHRRATRAHGARAIQARNARNSILGRPHALHTGRHWRDRQPHRWLAHGPWAGKRVLVWSIIIYGVAAFRPASSTSLAEVMFWRSITVAAHAWSSSRRSPGSRSCSRIRRRRRRSWASHKPARQLGNFMIAGAYYVAVTWGEHLPEI